MNKESFSATFSILGTLFTFLIGGWDKLLQVLTIFIVIDIITGLSKAAINGKISSTIGHKGLIKKGSIFIVVILAYQMDIISNAKEPILRTMACYFAIGNEGISIAENLSAMGVPIPKFLLRILEKTRIDNDDKG